jgi:tRNA nucleotidyltransferase/poly(A) polymerase
MGLLRLMWIAQIKRHNMPSLQTTCPNCGKMTWLHHKNFSRYMEKYDCLNLDELAQKYLCQNCRKLLKPNCLQQLPEYQHLCVMLQTEYNTAIKRGINDMDVRQNFLKNIQHILDKRYIKRYTFEVSGNMLVGIHLHDIAFVGNVYISLKHKSK